jgi:phosphoglycolate phosphatase
MAALDFSAVSALIFDLDGTLIDSKQDLIRSVNAMLEKMGREKLHEDTISGYIGHGAPKLVARALGNGATEAEREQALRFFLAHYEEHKLDSTRPVSRGRGRARGIVPISHGRVDEQARARE